MTSQHENPVPVPVAWEEPEFDIPDPAQLYKIFYTYCIIGNNLMVLNRDKTMKLFQEYDVHAMKGDFSSHNQEIYDYIVANGSYGIPFYKIYGPKKPQGLVVEKLHNLK